MMHTWFSATLGSRPTSKIPKRKNGHSQLLGRIRFLPSALQVGVGIVLSCTDCWGNCVPVMSFWSGSSTA